MTDILAAEPLLERVETRRRRDFQARSLRFSPHEQFAVEDRGRPERVRDIGEAVRNVVAGAAEDSGFAGGMDQLHADPVPLPFGCIVAERHHRVVERVGQHERPEHRHVAHGRLIGAALGPVEQLGERRPQPVPHFLDRLDFQPEGVGQRLLCKTSADADAKRARRQLQQSETAGSIEVVEHRREHPGSVHSRCRTQPFDRVGDADRRIVDLGRLAGLLGPQQGDRLGHVADIVAAHVQQDRVNPLLGDGANRGALDRRDVERAGQRGKAVTAIRVGRLLEIFADELELGIARARVDEVVEQLREGAHRAFNARTAAGCLMEADGKGRENRGSVSIGAAVECLLDMFEARLDGDSMTREQGHLR